MNTASWTIVLKRQATISLHSPCAKRSTLYTLARIPGPLDTIKWVGELVQKFSRRAAASANIGSEADSISQLLKLVSDATTTSTDPQAGAAATQVLCSVLI